MVPELVETIQSQFPVSPAVADEQMKENILSALGRKGLHRIGGAGSTTERYRWLAAVHRSQTHIRT